MNVFVKIIKYLYKRPDYTTLGGKRITTGYSEPNDQEAKGIFYIYAIALFSSVLLIVLLTLNISYNWYKEKNILLIILFSFISSLILNYIHFKAKRTLLSITNYLEFVFQSLIHTFFYSFVFIIFLFFTILFPFLPSVFLFNKYLIIILFFIIFYHNFLTVTGFHFVDGLGENKRLLKFLVSSTLSSLILISVPMLISASTLVIDYYTNYTDIKVFIYLFDITIIVIFFYFSYKDTTDFTVYIEVYKLIYKTLIYSISIIGIIAIFYLITYYLIK